MQYTLPKNYYLIYPALNSWLYNTAPKKKLVLKNILLGKRNLYRNILKRINKNITIEKYN